MQIHSLRATFGKLQDETLTLSDGLNVIYAPNESGKSTWSRFLSCMLYGVNTRDRSPLADKNRYAPWNGGNMRGRMDFTHEGRNYTVTRDTRRVTAPMGEFRCTAADTADEVSGIDGANLGEILLGVPREVYERSGFIGQNALAVDQDAELERRIAALITTGEEDTSYSESYERLKRQLNRRRHNRTGQIPALENDIAVLRRQAENLERLNEEVSDVESRLAQAAQDTEEWQRQQLLWQQIHAQEQYRQARDRRQEAEKKLRELYDKAIKAKTAMESHSLHGAEESLLQGQLHPTLPRKPLSAALPTLLVCLGAAGAAAFSYFIFPHWAIIAAAALAVLGLLFLFLSIARRKKYDAAVAELTTRAADLQQQLNEYHLLRQNAVAAIGAAKEYKTLFDTIPREADLPTDDLPTPPIDAAQVEARLTVAREEVIRLRSRLDTLTGQIQALGDGASIRAQLQEKQEQLAAAETEYEAVVLAMSVLENANATLQNRFSPALGQRAAEIFGRLTGGRYEKVLLRRDFSVQAETRDDPTMRSIQFLSQGAADQLYLAVRLAICDMVLPQDKSAPLLLDDALLSFDDTRLHAALDYLTEESQNRQILLFTCQKREQDYLQGRDGVAILSL